MSCECSMSSSISLGVSVALIVFPERDQTNAVRPASRSWEDIKTLGIKYRLLNRVLQSSETCYHVHMYCCSTLIRDVCII